MFSIRAVESILRNEPVMADQIVITEKSSQAKDVRAAVGSRYGDVLAAEGHLLDLLEPEDVVPAWKKAATKPPSSELFARHYVPPSGFGSPPTVTAKVSSSARKFLSIMSTTVR